MTATTRHLDFDESVVFLNAFSVPYVTGGLQEAFANPGKWTRILAPVKIKCEYNPVLRKFRFRMGGSK